ncbi:MAG: LysR family transcriptional regulator [Oscillospiraceae bacterium]
MESKKWEALLAATEAGSFTRAAETLGYTQSGLTHMMNSLEKEIGFPVLRRGRYGVQLTPAGEGMLPAVREFIRAGDRLERAIAAVGTAKAETIRVAAYASITVHWLPHIVQRFRQDYPDVHVDILRADSVEELCKLLEEKADIAFGGPPAGCARGSFDWIHLKNDPLLAVLPKDYPIGNRTTFPLEEFEGQEFLMSTQGFDPQILEAMQQRGIQPDIRPTEVDDVALITMVAHGLGISMLTELVMKGANENVLAIPVAPASFRELGILTHSLRDASPMLRKFISYAEPETNRWAELPETGGTIGG